jgi:predicted nucleic acid-binding protein
MSGASGEPPVRVVLDAGPLIALLHGADPDHAGAVAGFRRLAAFHTRLVTPLPVVFEVYKWLLFEGGAGPARVGLQRMRQSLDIAYPEEADLGAAAQLVAAMPAWRGTLEDAFVALTGLRLAAPVWTLNYRDLAAFQRLQFWT